MGLLILAEHSSPSWQYKALKQSLIHYSKKVQKILV